MHTHVQKISYQAGTRAVCVLRSLEPRLSILDFVSQVFPNPLTTDDECTRHATLATCYQLAQSILKIGFALAKKAG